ncbi:hypothetical protein [Prosthecobacter sp.]|uniref:hypothetical protein n=1 Tax=Prosthecobacter sp. TaxID=1965333 RepID=UPI0037843BE8
MLVRALEREGVSCEKSPLGWKPARALAKIAGLMGVRRLPFLANEEPIFAHLNHPWLNAFYPYILSRPLVTYSFDLWPDTWDEWQKLFELNRPRVAFISAKVPMREMQRRVPQVEFRWLPEAVDPVGFDASIPLVERPVDLLEIGRSFPSFHERVREPLAVAGFHHDFPQPSIPALRPYEDVVKAYARSKIAVCFPRSMTHPDVARGVETTTFRYFECMASKTLMIGHCPAELVEIMGYNPVIEADMEAPARQLVRDILPRISEFQELVNRNHAIMSSRWTVAVQAQRIRAALDEVLSASCRRGTCTII